MKHFTASLTGTGADCSVAGVQSSHAGVSGSVHRVQFLQIHTKPLLFSFVSTSLTFYDNNRQHSNISYWIWNDVSHLPAFGGLTYPERKVRWSLRHWLDTYTSLTSQILTSHWDDEDVHGKEISRTSNSASLIKQLGHVLQWWSWPYRTC